MVYNPLTVAGGTTHSCEQQFSYVSAEQLLPLPPRVRHPLTCAEGCRERARHLLGGAQPALPTRQGPTARGSVVCPGL